MHRGALLEGGHGVERAAAIFDRAALTIGNDHRLVRGFIDDESKCPRGHLVDTPCGKPLAACRATVDEVCQKGHKISFVCSAKSKECRRCKALAEEEMKQRSRLAEEAEKRSLIDAEYDRKLAQANALKLKEQSALHELDLEKKRLVELERIKIETLKLRREKEIRMQINGGDVSEKIAQMKADAHKQMEKREVIINSASSFTSGSGRFDVDGLMSLDGRQLVKLMEPFVVDGDGIVESLVSARDLEALRTHDPSPIFTRGMKLVLDGHVGDAGKLFGTLKGADAIAMDLFCRSKLGDSLAKIGNVLPVNSLSVPMCCAYCCILGEKKDSQKFLALSVLYGLVALKHGVPWKGMVSAVRQACSSSVALLFRSTETSYGLGSNDDASARWREQVNIYGAQSEAMEALVQMVGLEEVKLKLLQIHAAIELDRERMIDPNDGVKKRLHAIFCGNPGTGKTTVARLYGKFLYEMKAIKGSAFEEITAAKLVADGVPALKGCVDKLLGAGGGTLFIDEAYQLKGDLNGRRVLDYLLPELESWIGSIAVVFAGYKKKMEELLEHNEGLPSRFPYMFHFADYNDDELMAIMKHKMKTMYPKQALVVEDEKPLRILIRRLGMGRGKDGFGNARAVDVWLNRILERQAIRVLQEKSKGVRSDAFSLKWTDLLGPDPVVGLEKSKAWKELSGMIGLGHVKSAVSQMLEVVRTNVELEKLEKPIQNLSLNRCFLGNPGVGKTTVAKLYAELLRDIGLLSKGELHVKSPSDFIGSVLGESEMKTRAVLRASEGCVLLIDEAYGLYSKGDADPYKKAVIDAIVGEVQNVPGDDRCVIMCGYQAQMDEMMREGNPGLARRFSIDTAFVFDDFSDDELHLILNHKLRKRDARASFSAQLCAVNVLAMQRRRRNFGNGGAVETLISEAVKRMNIRLQLLAVSERVKNMDLVETDFDPDYHVDRERAGAEEIFSGLVGCGDIKKKMKEYIDAISFNERRGKDRLDGLAFNFKFVGAPGTGKTTVARKMGVMFHALGVLGSDDVVSVSASHLIAEFVGQTGPKTRQKLDEALGRVLFIDEAYRLKEGPFAKEALDEIVNLLTEERYYRKLVVILAGYEKDIDQLMRSNAGLESRFSEKIVFDNFSADDCVSMMKKRLFDAGLELCLKGQSKAKSLFEQLTKTEDWGNGRDVETLCNNLKRSCAPRLNKLESVVNAGDLDRILEVEVVDCISAMLKERISRTSAVRVDDSLLAPVRSQALNPHPAKLSVMSRKVVVASPSGAGPPPVKSANDGNFVDPILEEIEKCLAEERDEKERNQLEAEKTHLLEKKKEWAELKKKEEEEGRRADEELARLKREHAVEANREKQFLSGTKKAIEKLESQGHPTTESEVLARKRDLAKKLNKMKEQEQKIIEGEKQRENVRQKRKRDLENAKKRIADQRARDIERELARQT